MTEQARDYDKENQQRDAAVYLYLLNSLTDLGISEDSPKPNEYKISKQWDQNRMFVRRVLRSVKPELYDQKEGEDKVPGLTLSKLVHILASLQDYATKESAKNKESKMPRTITKQEKQRALQLYSQLLPEEREKLGIIVHPEASLLDQLKEKVTDQIRGLSSISLFYKQAMALYTGLKMPELSQSKNSDVEIDEFLKLNNQIESYLQKRIDIYYPGLNDNFKQEKIEDLTRKILSQVSRTELQTGLRQVRSIFKDDPKSKCIVQNLKNDSISNLFLEGLVDSIIENNMLRDQFPIYIDYIEVEKVAPLPLKVCREKNYTGLINQFFIEDSERQSYYFEGLDKQTTQKVIIHFYIYLSNDWKPRFEIENSSSFKVNGSKIRLNFREEIIGIGSIISHINTAINQFLFKDIPLLKAEGYLPVAQKIFAEDRIVGDTRNSLICSSTIVKLCKKKDLEQAIKSNIKYYNEIVIDQELALGEYYGFDLIESTANSALIARLRALKQAGINSQIYLQQICQRIEEKYVLNKAENYLVFHPFSLRAMQDYLKNSLFKDKYRQWDGTNFKEVDDKQPWSDVAYKAHLKIIQAYLQEGLYRLAKKYIDIIEPHIENERLDDKLLMCLYYNCLFRYHYYTDFQDPERSHEQRGSAIRKAEQYLNDAKKILKDHLRDYSVIGEYSQTNAHPFFYYLSRVYANRAKLYIFFPYIAEPPSSKNHLLIEPISLLEKARIYAARDGNPNHYAYWTAYQVWCYLIVAYLGDPSQLSPEFSREKCIEWSKRLIENALVCYAERGKKSYQQIKDNSGKQTIREENDPTSSFFYEKYGDIFVQTIPPIIEREESKKIETLNQTSLLELPMSVLTYFDKSSGSKVYLFGTYSSILLFGLGIVELCEDPSENDDLESNIIMAMRRFTMCAAIAAEGTFERVEKEQTYLQRKFADDKKMPEDFRISGLYPHRLTHFALQGKIFAAASRTILWLYKPQEYSYQEEIQYLLSDLHDEEPIKQTKKSVFSLGQKRYSGHLSLSVEKVKKYFEEYLKNPPTFANLNEVRNKIVTDVFKILRGDMV